MREGEAQAAYATTRGLCVLTILTPSGLLMGAVDLAFHLIRTLR